MRAAPNPRTLTGWSGASPHVLRFPCGLSSGFPFARWVPPLRPPSAGFPSSGVLRLFPSAVARFRFPFGFPPGSFPLGKFHASAAEERFRRPWSRAAGTKVTSSAATASRGSRNRRATDERRLATTRFRYSIAPSAAPANARHRRAPIAPNGGYAWGDYSQEVITERAAHFGA
jgi:hypothetical protein